jgi:REP element-mobilizing transposase RayT
MRPETTAFYRRSLPHWKVSSCSYFVTFRLKNSIPKDKLFELKNKYDRIKSECLNDNDLLKAQRIHFLHIEKIIDSNRSADDISLATAGIAEIIMERIEWMEKNTGWRIPSYVIMPTHIHCLMNGEKADRSLSKALQLLKGYTAKKANDHLKREGAFWSPESFDYWCRSSEKKESAKRYIRNNPVKAGLVKSADDWPWLK